MKLIKLSTRLLIASLFVIGLAFQFGGCSKESPFEPETIKMDENSDNAIICKKGIEVGSETEGYHQNAEMVLQYGDKKNGYKGGKMKVDNGTAFEIKKGALTPPPELMGEDITLTMSVDLINDGTELFFTFGPSGCHFDPPAEVWLKWSDLNTENAKLFYVESNGEYTEQQPLDIDFKNKKVRINVHHFSRYALANTR